MTIEATLFSTLSADADVSPLVTNADSPQTWRIYEAVGIPKSTLPYVVYTIINQQTPGTLTDILNVSDTRIQVDVYDDSPVDARTLADHIIDAVNTGMGLYVADHQSFFENDSKLYRRMIDFSLWA